MQDGWIIGEYCAYLRVLVLREVAIPALELFCDILTFLWPTIFDDLARVIELKS